MTRTLGEVPEGRADVKPGSVLHRLEMIERAVEGLEARAGVLAQRLVPVISQEPRTDVPSVKEPMPPVSFSPVTERLHSLYCRVQVLASGLAELTERLQL